MWELLLGLSALGPYEDNNFIVLQQGNFTGIFVMWG